MKTKRAACVALMALLAGCANLRGTPPASAPAPAPTSADAATAVNPNSRVVKSKDGRFDGEVVGTPKAGGKFSRLQIGMEMNEVTALIGAANNMTTNETGKRWIPFYFGNDARRIQLSYAGEGCLTFTGGNAFGGGGNELIRIEANAQGVCAES